MFDIFIKQPVLISDSANLPLVLESPETEVLKYWPIDARLVSPNQLGWLPASGLNFEQFIIGDTHCTNCESSESVGYREFSLNCTTVVKHY